MASLYGILEYYYHYFLNNIPVIIILIAVFIMLSRVYIRVNKYFQIHGGFLFLFVVFLILTINAFQHAFHAAIRVMFFYLVFYFSTTVMLTVNNRDNEVSFFSISTFTDEIGYLILFYIFSFIAFFFVLGAFLNYSLTPIDVFAIAYVSIFLIDVFVGVFMLGAGDQAKGKLIVGVDGYADFLGRTVIFYSVIFSIIFLVVVINEWC